MRSKFYGTYAMIGGHEYDVAVEYTVNKPEPDVNEPGGIDIHGIYHDDTGCLMDSMSPDEIDAVYMQVTESAEDEAAAYADYLYDMRKDRELDRSKG